MVTRPINLTVLLLVFIVSVNAQPYYFRHYQVENGLSNNTVFCSAQDAKGLMWFGTKDGLNCFDGYRFKTYNIKNKDENILTRDLISSLAVDKKGVLWAGSQKGLYWFDDQQEKLIAIIDTLPDIHDLYITRNHLWFISNLTLCRYSFNQKELTIFPAEKFFSVTSICEPEEGSMWFSSSDGYLHQFDATTQKFKRYNVYSHTAPSASSWIEKMLPDKKGNILIGTSSQGIKKFNIASGEYVDLLTNNADKTSIYVRDILHVSDEEFWFATESGIFIFNNNTGRFINLKKNYLDPYSLSDNAIYTLHKDSEGGIWAGTYFGGINYFPKQYFSFQKYFPGYTKNAISGSAVREICEDSSGNIWIGTEDAGLNKLNVRTKEITRFEPTGTAASIAYSNIHGLLVVGNELWIGTFEHGLDILDIKTGQVKRHYTAGSGKHDLKSNFIVSMLRTKSGSIYLGSSNGVYRYNQQADNFMYINAFPKAFISCMLEDYSGNIWVGTPSLGAACFNPLSGETRTFVNEPNNTNSLTTNIINALYEDSHQNLWFATEGGGLCRLSKDKTKFKRYTTKNGLSSNFVFKVLEDDKKTLWITTSKGLVNMNVQQGTTTVFTKATGLLNDQFNYNSGYKDAQGKMYIGSVRGMIAFQPDDFYQDKFVPPVYLTGLQVNNRELEVRKDSGILKQSILHTKKIVLPYDQSSISIDFAAFNFTFPEMKEYRYMMGGLDNEWTYIKSNRKVYFTNLEPGTYTFKVEAGSNGVWNTRARQLTVHVTPPVWFTPWAYLLYFVVLSAILYYLVRAYHRMQESKKEKEIYQGNIEFFTNIAHEIKTPLTLIKGPVENLSEIVGEVPAIKEDVVTLERNTNRLVNLISQILDFRQIETKGFSLDFDLVNINEILQEAYVTFQPVAKSRKLSYVIELPPANIYAMADAEALNKIFNNLFSNAMKYAKTRVIIKLMMPKNDDERLVLEFSNDGYTIPANMKEKIFKPFFRLKETIKQKGTGIGLALVKSLVELHNGDIYLRDTKGDMNVFVLRLPFNIDLQRKKERTAFLSSRKLK